MKYAYYPGCTLHTSTKEYDMSTKAVCEKLEVELEEIEDWNCCG
ncbi:MAG: heterodisulfide reductase-related iron-sulfur binding cluster, partial [Methanosarcinales archaeon]